jgi:hypothetical protein
MDYRPTSAWFYLGGSKQYVLDDVIAKGESAIALDWEQQRVTLKLVGNAAVLGLPIYKRQDFSLRQGHYETFSYQLSGTTGCVPDCNRPDRLLFSLFDDRAKKMQLHDRQRFEVELLKTQATINLLKQQIKELPSIVDPRGLEKEVAEKTEWLQRQKSDGVTPPSLYLENSAPITVVESLTGNQQAIIETGGKITVSKDLADKRLCFVQWPIGVRDKAMYINIGSPLTDPISIQMVSETGDRYQLWEFRGCELQGKYSDNQPEYNLEFAWDTWGIVAEGVKENA